MSWFEFWKTPEQKAFQALQKEAKRLNKEEQQKRTAPMLEGDTTIYWWHVRRGHQRAGLKIRAALIRRRSRDNPEPTDFYV
jgi:hypothetical protein